jgi:hypothetical protein
MSLASSEVDGATILTIGAFGRNGLNTNPGRAFFYRFDATSDSWMLEADVQAPSPFAGDEFGRGVSVAPVLNRLGFTHRAAVGRINEVPGGAVYLYLRATNGSWQQEARLTSPSSNSNEMFLGQEVLLESDGRSRLLAAAPENRDFGTSSGCVYVYERDEVSGEWSATQAIYGREQDALDVFGFKVAIGDSASAGMAVIGAHTTQCVGGLQTDAVGAVYSFDLNPGEGNECPSPVIRLQKVPDCSSGPGGEIEVRWFQATPDQSARIAILYGRRAGNFAIPNGNPCAGLPLGLDSQQLQVAFIGSAGQFGAGRLKTNIPRIACGGYLQLLDVSRCELSNVVRIE